MNNKGCKMRNATARSAAQISARSAAFSLLSPPPVIIYPASERCSRNAGFSAPVGVCKCIRARTTLSSQKGVAGSQFISLSPEKGAERSCACDARMQSSQITVAGSTWLSSRFHYFPLIYVDLAQDITKRLSSMNIINFSVDKKRAIPYVVLSTTKKCWTMICILIDEDLVFSLIENSFFSPEL